MKRGLITLLVIAMLACIGLVSCKNEVQAPAEELVSVSFDKDSSRSLSSNLEGFTPGEYFWKYAAKKADGSNLISGQTASYDEAGALWIKEGKPGFSDTQGKYKVQGFSQGLWNFTLYGYKNIGTEQNPVYKLVYSGETTGILLNSTSNVHHVHVVVSPTQGADGTLEVKIVGDGKITLIPATSGLTPNTKVRLGIVRLVPEGDPEVVRQLSFIEADYNQSLAAGTYQVTVQFTNDDASVIFASGSVVSTVYSNLKTTIKGNLTEVVTYADFGAEQNPDIITTTIGTTTAINEGSTETAPISLSGTSTKVTASLSNDTAQSLITKLKTDLAADSTSSSMQLTLSVDTTEATETTITYEIGMEAVLTYMKNTVETTTTSTVKEVEDFVTVVIDMQAGLTDVSVTHSGNDMTSGEQWAEKTSRTTLELSDFLANAGTEANPDPNGYYYYYQYSENVNNTVVNKAQLYIKTKTFSPFKLSYTVPEAVAAIGSTTYTTLEAAVSAAVNGDTVILLKNVSVGAQILVDKTITLDLNGNTITGTQEEIDTTIFKVGNGTATGDLTIIGTTAGSAINAKAIAVLVKDNSKLTVNGGSYSNSYYVSTGTGDGNYIFDIYGANAKATIDSVILTGFVKGIRARGSNSSVTVSKSSADVTPGPATGDYVGYGWGLFCADQEGTLTIESGTYKTTYATSRQMIDIKRDGAVVIKDGSFTTAVKEGEAVDPIPALVVFNEAKTTADKGTKLTINGGTFTYGGKLGRVNAKDNHAVVSITGGTFNASSVTIDGMPGYTQYNLGYIIYGGLYYTDPGVDTSAQIAAGYIAAPQGTDPETWLVRPLGPEDYVASVTHGEDEPVLYLSLQSAIDAALSGDTVTLRKSISVDTAVLVDKSIILDGGQNKITRIGTDYSSDYTVDVYGSSETPVNVTVKNLTIETEYYRGLRFKDHISHGLIKDCSFTSKYNCPLYIGNGDTANTVKDVHIVDTSSTMNPCNPSKPWNNSALGVTNGAEVFVSGGEFTGPLAAYIMSTGGSLTIDDNATFTANTGSGYSGLTGIRIDRNYDEGAGEVTPWPFESDSVLTIKSGTIDLTGADRPGFNLYNSGYTGTGSWKDTVRLVIKGGTITGFATAGVDGNWCVATITGGTFDANPSAFVANGYWARHYAATATTAEHWTVEAIPSGAVFALINNETQEVKYLNDTIPSEQNPLTENNIYYYTGDHGIPGKHTLVLLRNYVFTALGTTMNHLIQFIGNDITFDLNGHKFTYNGGSAPGCVFVTATDGTQQGIKFMNGIIENPTDYAIRLFHKDYAPNETSFNALLEGVSFKNIYSAWSWKLMEPKVKD